MTTIKESYTRKVGGETFDYELDFAEGSEGNWQARVYRDGALKGTPSGALADNLLAGDDLKNYLTGYVENIIERGLDIAE